MEWRRPRGIRVERNAEIGRKTPWPLLVSPQSHGRARSISANGREECLEGQKILGARALYLYANGADTLYRTRHQPAKLHWAGGFVRSVRMLNTDIIELAADRVSEGTKVVVIATPAKQLR